MAFQDIGLRLVIMGTGEFRRGMNEARTHVQGLGRDLDRLSSRSGSFSTMLTTLGDGFMRTGQLLTTHLTIPLALLGGSLVAAGIQFEDAFAGVSKTVDGISDDFGNLTATGIKIRNEFRALALEIPVSVNELARIGELAGQLGIVEGELTDFVETVALLGVTTEMTSEDAATFFARFGNIMGVASKDMAEFTKQAGTTVVELGNKFAATEPEIASLTLRIAGAGQAAGLTAPQILAISTALASVGVHAEMGGSAVSRILLEVKRATDDFTATGGVATDQLTLFAQAAGMTVQQFVALQKNNPTEAFLRLIGGVNRLQETGSLTNDMLMTMNLDTIRLQDVLNRLGPNVDFVRGALKVSNDEWATGNALQVEAQKRFNTTKSQLISLRNAFSDLGITIFYLYKDDIDNLINGLSAAITKFSQLDDGVLKTAIKLGIITAAIGPLLVAFGSLLSFIGLALNGFKLLQAINIAKVFSPIISGQMLAGAASGVAGVFTTLTSIVGALASAFLSLVPVIALVAAGYLAIRANLFGIGDLFNTISYWAKTLWSNFINLTNVTDDLSAAWDDLKAGNVFRAFDHLTDAFNDMVFFFTVGAPTIDKAMQDIQTSIVTVFTNVADKIKGIDTVKEVILAVVGTAGGLLVLSKAFSTLLVIAKISAAFSPVLALFKAFLPLLLPLSPVLLALGAAFLAVKTNLLGIGDLFNTTVFWVKTLVADLINLTMFDEYLKQAFNLLLSGDLSGAWESIKLALDELLRFIQTGGPLFQQALTAIWSAFTGVLGNIGNWIYENVIPILVSALTSIITWITANAGTIKTQLLEWADAFLDWVGPIVDQLPDKLKLIVDDALEWIKKQVPELETKLKEWSSAFVNWISAAPGELLPKLGDLLAKVFDWLGKASIMLSQKLLVWGAAFLDWLGPVVRDILPKLGYFLGRILGWIVSAVVILIPELAKLTYQFLVWATNAATEIAPELRKFLTAVLDFFLYTLIPGIILGAIGIGKGLIDGVKQGIGDQWESFKSWVVDLFSVDLKGSIMNALGMDSPSKVFADIGKNIVKGTEIGLMGQFGSLGRTMTDMANRMIASAEMVINGGMMTAPFTTGTNTYNNSSNYSRTNVFSPTIHGANISSDRAVGEEIGRQYRMAVLSGA